MEQLGENFYVSDSDSQIFRVSPPNLCKGSGHVTDSYKMANVRECEKKRGTALTTLQGEIRQLRHACEVDAPNTRLVAKQVARLNEALDNLVDSHVAYVMKMSTQVH